MIEPDYGGRVVYLAADGQILDLAVRSEMTSSAVSADVKGAAEYGFRPSTVPAASRPG